MSESQNPREYDAVLGGNSPPPIHGAVLGGIEGLNRRLKTGNKQQQIESLASALKYGDAGIDLLIEALNDEEIKVRAKAFQLLQNVESEKAQKAIANLMRLNIGDKVYCVYQAYYENREDCCLYNKWHDDYDEIIPFYKNMIDDENGCLNFITGFLEEAEINQKNVLNYHTYPKLMFVTLDKESARKAVKILRSKTLLKMRSVSEFEFGEIDTEGGNLNLDEWCDDNQIGLTRQRNESNIEFQGRILKRLLYKHRKNQKLITEFWLTTHIDHLAFIHERIIDRKCYFEPAKSLFSEVH